jgi:DNA-directed RNA polymerase I, II, and III subunit RPABC1
MNSEPDKDHSTSANIAIYKSRQNLLELLKRQGFNTSDYEGIGTHEVHTMKQNDQLDMLLTSTDKNEPRKVYVKYFTSQRVNASLVHNVVDDLFVIDEVLSSSPNSNDTLIIVTKHQVNDTIVQLLNQLWSQSNYFIIIFTLDQLQFNILNHQYVPRHDVVSKSQTADVLKRFNVTDVDQLPNISRYDPVAQAIGIRPGEICKITRPSKTSIMSEYYRICT